MYGIERSVAGNAGIIISMNRERNEGGWEIDTDVAVTLLYAVARSVSAAHSVRSLRPCRLKAGRG